MSTRHIIPISGKDSLATALIQTAREPDLPYEYVFNDVGTELPETYAWLDTVEQATGWKIQRVGANLESIIEHKGILPSGARRFCTEYGKLEPMAAVFGSDPTVLYYGLRADEARVGARLPSNARAVYPLVEFGINLNGVWTLLAARHLLPPDFFWPSLYYRVCEVLGYEPESTLAEWETRMLFAGRSRANCYFCFYQRQYEYVWLAETHPDLFWRACRIERTTGAAGFTWLRGMYLDELLGKRSAVLDRRAREVSGIIARRAQGNLFRVEESELALTSCGLLCGK